MRGNLQANGKPGFLDRSIPAYAGEPTESTLARAVAQVYPRVCGGTWEVVPRNAHLKGLSPRMRGNPLLSRRCRNFRRSIPAYAGEPGHLCKLPPASGVYPRVCGGTRVTSVMTTGGEGLSPRMRGNPGRGPSPDGAAGSIPAYAGEPANPAASSGRHQVYPRVCGGTPEDLLALTDSRGLSPRMRGNLSWRPQHFHIVGSIPAYAGEPQRVGIRRGAARVYPRVCGGTGPPYSRIICVCGLSPRMRGNRRGQAPPAQPPGSIPAYAGEPPLPFAEQGTEEVYPRVCGGTLPASP